MTDINDVIARLQSLENFLRSHAVKVWPDKLERLRVDSEGQRELLKVRVLQLYKGTMGSLTDLVIACANGDEVDDEKAANDQLDRMVDDLWKRTQAL